MPELWFPGADKVGRPSNNSMSHNSKTARLTLHTSEGATGHGAAKSTLEYTLGKGIEYSAAVDVHSDEAVQCHPWTDGARSLLNGGLPGGGANRNGAINFQLMICGPTAHIEELIQLGMKPGAKFRKMMEWAHANGIPMIAPNHGDSRDLHKWETVSGVYSHGNTPAQDHVDGRNNWKFLEDISGHEKITTTHQHGAPAKDHKKPGKDTPAPHPSATPPDKQKYVVLVDDKPIGEDKGEFHIVANEDNWAVKELPHIRILREEVKPRVDWALAQGYEVKVLKLQHFSVEHGNKAEPPADHKDHAKHDAKPDAKDKGDGKDKGGGANLDKGIGDVRLQSGSIWPDDEVLMHKLHQLSAKLGKPIMVVSGLRRTGSAGDLKRNVQPRTQFYFWELFKSGRGNLAASPGTSQHEQRGPGKGASDTDVITGDGKLVSLGNYPGGYAAGKALGLHWTASGEAWHVSCSGPDRWHP